jgi:surfactin synthase thioesterase subunit
VQKFISVNGLRLSYLEKNSTAAKTIFFLHGNSGSSATWKKQINDPLFSEYRRVAIDLPGHGDSLKSDHPEEDYSPIGTAKILAETISLLSNNTPYLLIGISYGTNLIAEVINFNLNPAGIVLMGLCCLGENFGMDKVFKQMDAPNIFSYNEMDRKTVEHFIASFVEVNEDEKSLVDDYFKTDEQFKPELMKAAANNR